MDNWRISRVTEFMSSLAVGDSSADIEFDYCVSDDGGEGDMDMDIDVTLWTPLHAHLADGLGVRQQEMGADAEFDYSCVSDHEAGRGRRGDYGYGRHVVRAMLCFDNRVRMRDQR
jgi:hypothetical protein